MLEHQFTLHIEHRDAITAWSLCERVDADRSDEVLVGLITREVGGKGANSRRRNKATISALVGVIDYLDGSGIPDAEMPSTLMVLDVYARSTMRSFATSFGSLAVPMPAEYPDYEEWRAHAEGSCVAMIDEKTGVRRKPKQPKHIPVMSAATDGSFSIRGGGGGCGWIRSDGVCGSFPVHVASVLDTEVLAIHSLLKGSPGLKLRIASDSKAAIAVIEGRTPIPAKASARFISAVHSIRDAFTQTGSTITWVRGHSGDPLNEGADRLAVLARRQHNTGIDPEITHEVRDRIVTETITAYRENRDRVRALRRNPKLVAA